MTRVADFRWNFDDFWHSLILIFRVLCGEWIEPLWDCMRANGEICMIVFLPSLVFGNFIVSPSFRFSPLAADLKSIELLKFIANPSLLNRKVEDSSISPILSIVG